LILSRPVNSHPAARRDLLFLFAGVCLVLDIYFWPDLFRGLSTPCTSSGLFFSNPREFAIRTFLSPTTCAIFSPAPPLKTKPRVPGFFFVLFPLGPRSSIASLNSFENHPFFKRKRFPLVCFTVGSTILDRTPQSGTGLNTLFFYPFCPGSTSILFPTLFHHPPRPVRDSASSLHPLHRSTRMVL